MSEENVMSSGVRGDILLVYLSNLSKTNQHALFSIVKNSVCALVPKRFCLALEHFSNLDYVSVSK